MDIVDKITQSKLVLIAKNVGEGSDFFKEINCRYSHNYIQNIDMVDVMGNLQSDKINIIDLLSLNHHHSKYLTEWVARSIGQKKLLYDLRNYNNHNPIIIKTHTYKGIGDQLEISGGTQLVYPADLVISLSNDIAYIKKDRTSSSNQKVFQMKDILKCINRNKKIDDLLNFSN